MRANFKVGEWKQPERNTRNPSQTSSVNQFFGYLAWFLQVTKKSFQTAPLKMCFGENLNFPCRVLGWNITQLKGERVEEEAHLRLRNERTGSTRREQRARLKHTEQAEISIRKERQKDSSCLPPERRGWRKREASSAVEKQGGATGEGWESEGKYRARGKKKINGNTW